MLSNFPSYAFIHSCYILICFVFKINFYCPFSCFIYILKAAIQEMFKFVYLIYKLKKIRLTVSIKNENMKFFWIERKSKGKSKGKNEGLVTINIFMLIINPEQF